VENEGVVQTVESVHAHSIVELANKIHVRSCFVEGAERDVAWSSSKGDGNSLD
jgi:hypothetical protein